VLVMPVAFNLVIAAVLDMFVKPEAAFTDLAIWFGGSGLVFGLVVAVLLMLLTSE
jgi:cellobiose-specific phosphotransferase system component IIC